MIRDCPRIQQPPSTNPRQPTPNVANRQTMSGNRNTNLARYFDEFGQEVVFEGTHVGENSQMGIQRQVDIHPNPTQADNQPQHLAQYFEQTEQGGPLEDMHDNRSEIQRFLEEQPREPQFSTRRNREPEEEGDMERQRRKRPSVVDAWDPQTMQPRAPEPPLKRG